MYKKVFIAVLAVLMLATASYGIEMAGVSMPDTVKAGDASLALNGAGIRTKFFMDMYVGGLFLKQKSSDAAAIINADEPMAVRLHIISGLITSEKMEDAVREGFEKSTNENTAPIQQEIENFINVFKEKINVNDIYEFFYIPGKGLEVYKNGAPASVVPGIAFKKALFGIWLCDSPAQKSLKEAMLGK
jgi:hypothetical protein